MERDETSKQARVREAREKLRGAVERMVRIDRIRAVAHADRALDSKEKNS